MKHKLLALLTLCLMSLPLAQPSGTLTIAQAIDPQNWDPIDTFLLAWGMVGSNIYDGLVSRNLNLEIEPGLATSWEFIDETNTQLRFKLREGVTFHNGEPFNAAAVKFTFDRLLGEEGAKGPQQSNYTSIDRVEIVDDYTVDFFMGSPDPVIITKLAGYGAMIVPPGYISENSPETFDRMPVGTGPFKVVEYNVDENLIIEANPDYWGGAPKLERIEYRFIAEDATRVAEMQAGRADIVQGVPVSLATTIEDLPDAHIESVGSPTVNVLRFNFCAAPTDDVNVRQAISHAIDREGIIAAILQGYGTPINSFQSELSLGHDPSIENYNYDPELAKKMLSDAGVAPGTPLQIDFVGTDQISREIVQAVSAMLDTVGFKTSLQSHEANTYFNDVVPQNSVGNLYTFGWGGWTLDFDNTAYLLFMPEQFWNPCFSDEEIGTLLEQQRQTYDQAERERILQTVAKREHDLIIDVPLYQSVNLWGVADRVKDFMAPADDRHQLLNVSVTE